MRLMIINEVNGLKAFLRRLEEKGKSLGVSLSPHAREWVHGKTNSKIAIDTGVLDKLRKLDKGKTVQQVKEEICKKQTDPVISAVICENKTYKDIGIDRSRGDWRVILTLFIHGVFDPDKIMELLPADSKARENEKWDRNKYFLLTLTRAFGVYKKLKKFKKEMETELKETEKKRKVKELLSDVIMSKYDLVTFYQVTQYGESVIGTYKWAPEMGVYEPYEKRLRGAIREEIKLLEKIGKIKISGIVHASKNLVDNIIDEIRDSTMKELPEEIRTVAFKNATLNWLSNKLNIILAEDRDPSVFAFNYIPHEINVRKLIEFTKKKKVPEIQEIEELAKKLCPRALQVFKDWAGERWILLFELIGYTLYPLNEYKKAFILVGPRDSGKSTFLKLIRKLLGRNNVSAVRISDLLDTNRRFMIAELYNKLANVSTEVKDYTFTDTETLKLLTGEDLVTAERKFKDSIMFVPQAKFIIATNELPYVSKKMDEAFWSRWVIIPFVNQFERREDWFDQVFTEKEISGILTVAIVAFARVKYHGKFDYSQTVEDVKDLWLSQKDSVYMFVSELIKQGKLKVTKNADDYVKSAELYHMYKNFCLDRGLTIVTMKGFTRRLREFFGVVRMLKNVNGERARAFVGVKIVDNTGENVEK